MGSGALQIALVVALATGLVMFFGGGALSTTEAGVSALLDGDSGFAEFGPYG